MFSGIKWAYNDINSSTLTGAIDVIVIKQAEGTYNCGPFHVRFGKLTAIHPVDKHVEVYVNGHYLDFIHMRLGCAGDAYFVEDPGTFIIDSDNESNYDAKSLPDTIYSNCRPLDEASLTPNRRRRRRARCELFNSESDSSRLFDTDGICSDEDTSYKQSGSAMARGCECLSDGEYSTEVLHDTKTLAPHFSSESALTLVTDKIEKPLQWDWGNFPTRAGFTEDLAVCSDEFIKDSDSCLSDGNKIIASDQPKDISSNNAPKDGVYLEDLVTSKVCEQIKQNYIYPPLDNYNPTCAMRKKTVNDFNLIDAGYKSDGECSPCATPNCHSTSDLKLSLCGNLTADSPIQADKFYEHLISFEDFLQDPDGILSNPNLVILLNGKYLNWAVAAPIIVSMLAFQTELPHLTLRRLEDLHMPKKKARRKTWFSWGMRTSDPTDTPVSTTSSSQEDQGLKNKANDSTSSRSSEAFNVQHSIKEMDTQLPPQKPVHKPTKRNRLTSDEVCQIGLKPGRNELEFRVTTKYQGTCSCTASIFLWDYSDRVVISDVDGTITRSDVLGHLLPMLGRDWTHDGVAQLYHQIANNGYKFLYLSSRPLGQAGLTRSYLRQIEQEGCFHLPDGPILLSPNSLLRAFHLEVIEKTPEIFKIQCLTDVRALFPVNSAPLYAGFGNKTNDVLAYIASGLGTLHIVT
ncbi:unnamed protein product [Protopolystoma xenopodis]|uniref:phosphatidate phosphatase n=1 Tax=Protopolystoma xenopodis TaxID=117903 RepID=A0A448WVU1_9PLAT|nr:unnamed protein product [Protopolystoma xenopodis]